MSWRPRGESELTRVLAIDVLEATKTLARKMLSDTRPKTTGCEASLGMWMFAAIVKEDCVEQTGDADGFV